MRKSIDELKAEANQKKQKALAALARAKTLERRAEFSEKKAETHAKILLAAALLSASSDGVRLFKKDVEGKNIIIKLDNLGDYLKRESDKASLTEFLANRAAN